jgi:hypothetical protein
VTTNPTPEHLAKLAEQRAERRRLGATRHPRNEEVVNYKVRTIEGTSWSECMRRRQGPKWLLPTART